MRRIPILTLIAAAAFGPAPTAAQVVADAWTEAAETFIRQLQEGDFSGAAAMVEPAAGGAMDAARLEAIWTQLTAAGPLQGWTLASVQSAQGYRVVDLSARFGAQPLKLRVAVNAERQVGGFFVLPAEPPPYVPPAYVDTTSFREETLTIGDASFPLGATLTVPRGEGPFPVVVLVHGSGPQDRDETIGANRPFRDLAWGLASRGVAVLRYDKRTFAHGARMTGAITVEEEVIADALSALDAARAHAATDPDRSFLLGHSLGGMLAPEIVARDADAAGLIALAGSPRTLGELIRDQLAYVSTLPANATPQAKAALQELRAATERLERREMPPDEVVMGAPASYFYDFLDRDPAARVREVAVPMLFLQGGRDYQVTARDLELWRDLVGDRNDAQFTLYDDLNHLFMTGRGMATPAEYVSAAVDRKVIEDLAAFIVSR